MKLLFVFCFVLFAIYSLCEDDCNNCDCECDKSKSIQYLPDDADFFDCECRCNSYSCTRQEDHCYDGGYFGNDDDCTPGEYLSCNDSNGDTVFAPTLCDDPCSFAEITLVLAEINNIATCVEESSSSSSNSSSESSIIIISILTFSIVLLIL